jgi:hypothetical protein
LADLLQTASIWLDGVRHSHLVQSVTYVRPSVGQVIVNATLGATVYEIDDSQGIGIKTESRDFILRADDLVLAGQKELPEAGDRIEVTLNGVKQTYEVMPLGGEPSRDSDRYKEVLRVHSKQIKVG